MSPTEPKAPSTKFTYKAFISYSHAADDKLAPALQSSLQSFAKPWYKLRALRIFRDTAALTVKPKLWSSIQVALYDSEYFLLLASVEARRSVWVQREVEHWLQNRSLDKLIVVVTCSSPLVLQDAPLDFRWIQENLLPTTLAEKFPDEPLYLDLRWVKCEEQLSPRNPRFLNEIAGLSATLTNRVKDELIGEDVRQHRTQRRLTWSAAAALIALTLASVLAAVIATWQKDVAVARQLVATSVSIQDADPEIAVLTAAQAVAITWPWAVLPEAEEQLHRSVLAPRLRLKLTGHHSSVLTVAWSPDEKRLVTGHSKGVGRREG